MPNIRNLWLDVFFLLVIQQYKCDGSTASLNNPTNTATYTKSLVAISSSVTTVYMSKNTPTTVLNSTTTTTGKITKWVRLMIRS
jgi:hypothetical protein